MLGLEKTTNLRPFGGSSPMDIVFYVVAPVANGKITIRLRRTYGTLA
jgi:hypothetical protein